jgi:deoxyribonuclease-4
VLRELRHRPSPKTGRAVLLGSHESVAGGLEKAFGHAEAHGDEAIQIFTKNANQWKEPLLAATQIAAFRAAHAAWGGRPVISHGSYLVNLCTDKVDVLEKSRDTVALEMVRCEELGVAGIAFHPGAALAMGEDAALDRIAEGLSLVLDRNRAMQTRLCIENTAGQGSTLGWSLDQIAAIIDRTSGGRERLGVCLDTQHLFAAGYDLRTAAGYDAFFDELDAKIGIGKIAAFHLNDSKKPLGERVDRHEEIGMGQIGLYPFWRLMNDARFAETAGIVELPRETAATSMARLKALRGAPEPKETRLVRPLELTPPPVKTPRRGKPASR